MDETVVEDLPARVALSCYRGATFDKTFTYGEEDSDGVMTPTDLTDWHASARVTDADGVVTEYDDGSNGGITLGADAGTVRWVITDEQSELFAGGQGSFDLFLEPPTGDKVPLMFGPFSILHRSLTG